jgi:hypothetical protein
MNTAVRGGFSAEKGACASGFLDNESAKLDLSSVLATVAVVFAVLALARMVNLYFGGMA